MIGTIRRHSTALWLIVIAAIIITFVYWGTPNQGNDRGSGGKPNFGSINGQTISEDDFAKAQRELYIRYLLSNGDWPDKDSRRTGFDLQRETYFRLLLLQKVNDLGLYTDVQSAAKTASEILRSIGRGNPVSLDVFVKNKLSERGLTAADFERFVQHEMGIQQLMSAAGVSGRLVTDQELRALYEREHEELSVQAVFFSASNYLSSPEPSSEAVSQFFTNQMARYRLPERVQVSYVLFEFGLTNHMAGAETYIAGLTNLAERIEAIYKQVGSNYFSEAKTPEEAKAKIRELMVKDYAMSNAMSIVRKEANAFASLLYTNETVNGESLGRLAKDKGLTVRVTQPFDREQGPSELKVTEEFTRKAFRLGADEPFAGPLLGEEGAYIIVLARNLPSEIPAFDQIRERVAADLKFIQAAQQARQAGLTFYAAVTNGIAAGKGFTAICTEEKVKPVLPPPFSISSRSVPEVEERVQLNQFKQAAFTTPPGQASTFMPTFDGGFVVFVKTKLPMDETKLAANLPGFRRIVMQTRQNEAFNAWFRREAERGLRDIPAFRQPPNLSGATRQ